MTKAPLPTVHLRHMLAEAALRQLSEVLDHEDIDHLVLKGPHLASTVYADPSARDIDDLDVLIRPEHFARAWEALRAAGFQSDLVPRGYDPKLLAPNGWLVELHRALAPYELYPLDLDELFSRSEPFVFGKVEARGLGAEDLLLHLVIHAAKSLFRAIAVKHLVDVERLATQGEIDWPTVLARARIARCRTAAWVMLSAAVAQHRAPVPSEVIEALRPSRRRRWWLQRWLRLDAFPLLRHEHLPRGAMRVALGPAMQDGFRAGMAVGFRFAGEAWRRRWEAA